MIRAVLLVSLLFEALVANEGRIIRREYQSATPPSASQKPSDPNALVIRRVYRRIDQNAIDGEKSFNLFAGASFDVFRRDRKIEIKTKNNGDLIKVGSRYETANGDSHSFSEKSDETAPNIEIGLLGGGDIYYGGRLGMIDDFAELSAFAGVRFQNASIASFTPYLQAAAGAGYEDFKDGIAPDNLSLSIGAGVERTLIGESLSVSLCVFYRHRFWQRLEKRYGDEYWRDGETGASVGVRYAFNR
ncbi:MAG: hypothetical protein LBP89_01355 [Helicobacteraceae bacterium]|jgi:hypothetical protein|nr:hypothetical protein [Helicobacteraceae bacterium]